MMVLRLYSASKTFGIIESRGHEFRRKVPKINVEPLFCSASTEFERAGALCTPGWKQTCAVMLFVIVH